MALYSMKQQQRWCLGKISLLCRPVILVFRVIKMYSKWILMAAKYIYLRPLALPVLPARWSTPIFVCLIVMANCLILTIMAGQVQMLNSILPLKTRAPTILRCHQIIIVVWEPTKSRFLSVTCHRMMCPII